MEGKMEVVSVKGDEVLVRLKDCLKMDARVTDKSGRVLGKVVRIMGPVKEPYGLIKMKGGVKPEDDLYIKC
ncbi:MAG: hypothetical protein ACP5NK_02150 [Thermoplasmata archaeon]